MNQSPENPDDAVTLRAADTWQEEGFPVWAAIAQQIDAEAVAPPSEMALLLAEIRACRAEMGGLRAEIAALKSQLTANKPTSPMPTLLPFAPPAPPLHLS